MTITTGSIPRLLKAGLDTIWGEYKDKPYLYTQFMNVKGTDDSYTETVEVNGFGFATQKAESKPFVFEDFKQQKDFRSFVATYAKGFIISYEALKDNRYMPLGERGIRGLARSLRSTKEQNNADILNDGFSSTRTYGDGSPLLSTTHSNTSGNQANTFTAIKTFSETSLEDYLILIDKMEDDKGLPVDAGVKCLVVPPNLRFDAKRILESDLQSGTANNDVNAIYALGSIPKLVVNRYLTSTAAYFFVTDVDDGLSFYERESPMFDQYMDSDTLNKKFYAMERYVATVDDWRGSFGDAGA